MASSQQPKRRDGVLSALDVFIQALNLAKDTCGVPPAQVAFGAASILLTMIRDTMVNDQDYIDLGRDCGGVCQALYRRLKGKDLDHLNQSVLEAIGGLTTTVAEIERRVVKQGKRNALSRFILAKGDKDRIAAWKQDLLRVLHVFNTELAIDTHMMVADIHRNVLTGQDGTPSQTPSTQASVPLGESPPPAPRDCFGRDQLVGNVVKLAENLEPIALIGAGGIGKTSVALTVLHHYRIKQRFGENRRFIRCDQFSASHAHFLARLSEVIGARVENPEDLTPLRPFLSSKDMLIVLDNAESILDPKGTSAEEIYSVVEELCQFDTVCLCITSRITTVPPRCKRPKIPTLSTEAACDIFYGIYCDDGRSSIINGLLKRLDFHALSITLLATTACHNAWDYDRLAEEWGARRAQVLQTDYNKSLAATIELSLASPTFCSLGPNARDLLGVVAFFPQGINEKNVDWLFPTLSNGKHIFDKFCVLSLTYRSNGFTTMLAPIRDYLSPPDPRSSPLFCATRDCYFSRMSVGIDPGRPGFEEAQWIASEDVNVEHLFDVLTSVDTDGGDIWNVCSHFMVQLYWHKPRQTVMGSKIEALPDDHPYKPKCLFQLSRLFERLGNHTEQKRLLTHTLELERQRGVDSLVARALRYLSNVNQRLGLHEDGIRQGKEALELYERIGQTTNQVRCLIHLARLLFNDGQLDAAENAASRAIDLIPEKGEEFTVCKLHRVLGNIYSKDRKEKAIHNFHTALRIASPFNWKGILFWVHLDLAELFYYEGELDDANTHIEQAKSHAVDDAFKLSSAMHIQAKILYLQLRLEEAKSEALGALEIYERCGAAEGVGLCRDLLQMVGQAIENQSICSQL